MPTIAGRVTNKIKQHDMSVFWIKEETSNQHAGVYTPSLSPSLHPSLWLTVIPSWQGWPLLCLYICTSLFTTGQLGQASETETIDHGPDSGPQAGTALLFGLCDDFLKKGAPPSLIGLAWLRFGLEPPYLTLPCMSTENTLDSLAACLGHARVSKTDRVWSRRKIGWGSASCGAGSFPVASPVPRSTTMRTLAAVITEAEVNGVHLK